LSATGLKDSHTTPLDTLLSGVEIHANVADNILNNIFLSRPPWSPGVELLITLISGTLVSLVLASAPPLISLVLPGVCAFGLWFGALGMLKTGNMFFSPLYPLINVIGCFAFLSLLRFRMAEKESRKRAGEIHRMETELNVAREIQMGVIPKVFPPFPDQDNFDLYADLIPAREVGGDLYDFFFMDEDHLCFTIGDVADKGVPASLFMVITRTLVKNLSPFCTSPADLMTRINDILSIDNPKSLFVTLFIGVLNLKTGEVAYANGGHNPSVIFSGSKGIFYKTGISGPAVGAMPDMTYEDLSFTLEPGDSIFLYTDGVTEAMDKEMNEFTDKALLKICTTLEKESVTQVVKEVLQQVRRHAGKTPQSDDIAMLMLRFHKPQKRVKGA
jgi:sigma-B regulation protein RsbU (phosphoserine phosphatase)